MPVALNIVKFFNEYNVEHLAAYKHLRSTGSWPKRFVPKDIDIPHNWQILIANKMADAWLEQAMAGNVNGIPEYFPPD